MPWNPDALVGRIESIPRCAVPGPEFFPGIRTYIDKRLPPGTLLFVDGGVVVGSITNIGDPSGTPPAATQDATPDGPELLLPARSTEVPTS
jgi:hypothetical protein